MSRCLNFLTKSSNISIYPGFLWHIFLNGHLHVREPYGVYLTKYRTILRRTYSARAAAVRIIFKSNHFNGICPGIVRCLVGHRTMSDSDDKRHEHCPSGHRPMLYESNCHRWEAKCICRSTYYIYIDLSLLKTKTINTKNIFRLSSWGWITCNEQGLLKCLQSLASVSSTLLSESASLFLIVTNQFLWNNCSEFWYKCIHHYTWTFV